MLEKSGGKKLQTNLLVTLLLFLLASAVTWPLLVTNAPHDHADTLFNTWIVLWNNHAIFSGNNPMNLPIFSGFPDGNGRNDLLLTQSLVAMPMQIIGLNPIKIHNLLLVLSLTFAGFAMFVFAKDIKTSLHGAIFAGVATIFLPFFQSHLWHLQLFSIGFSILAIVYALRLLDGKAKGWQLSLLILLQSLSSLYYWYFLNLSLLLLLLYLIFQKRIKQTSKLILWWIAGNLLVLPFLQNHLTTATNWSVNSITSTDLTAFFAPWGNSFLIGWLRTDFVHPETALWPELSVLTGFVWFFINKHKQQNTYKYRYKYTGYFIVIISFFTLFSLGPTLVVFGKAIAPTPFRLTALLPGCASIRLPARAAIFAFIPMILLAGKTLGKKPKFAILGIILSALTIFHKPIETTDVLVYPYTNWLKEQNIEHIVYLPVFSDLNRPETETLRMFSSISHFTPSVNGYSTSLPENYLIYADILNSWPSPKASKLIEKLDIDCVILENIKTNNPDTVFYDGKIHFFVVLPKNN